MSVLIMALTAAGLAQEQAQPPKEASPDKVLPAKAATLKYQHEAWGQTNKGEGIIFGPWSRTVGMTAVDIDIDGDNDFVFPNTIGNPELMRNLGSSDTFYPGGIKELSMDALPSNMGFSLSVDFADLTGDGLPDLGIEVDQLSPYRRHVVWYKNNGPASNPSFKYQGIIYTSTQTDKLPATWVKFADINADGKVDLFVCEAFTSESVRPHRVFLRYNTGSAIAPAWGPVSEITELSELLPDRLVRAKALKTGEDMAAPIIERRQPAGEKATYTYALGDFELAYWNKDDVLDVMFYDRTEGLMWIKNLGTAEAPVWDNKLNNGGSPIYDHAVTDGLTLSESSFALCRNPNSASPGEEWLDDIFISVNNLLKTYRYYNAESAYRIVQARPIAYPTGQGVPAFWDYDDDGDADLFRMAINSSGSCSMLLFPNIGMPYGPIWGEYSVLSGVTMSSGSYENYGRQDLYAFADIDADNETELLVQGQDGHVQVYGATRPTTDGGLPSFQDLGYLFYPAEADVLPTGVAAADFDNTIDGKCEVFISYYADSAKAGPEKSAGGNLIMYDTYLGTYSNASYMFPDYDGSGTLNPTYIESLAPADLNQDGLMDLVVAISDQVDYSACRLLYYRNTTDYPNYSFTYGGEITAVSDTDPEFARMPAFADIDLDGDYDLFVGHHQNDQTGVAIEHYQRFYRNGGDTGLAYWHRRSVANQYWTFTWNGALPQFFTVVNASGHTLYNPGHYQAGVFAPCVDIIQSTDGDPNVRMFIDVFPAVAASEAKAILVVGGDPDDGLYTTFRDLAGYAYSILATDGFPASSIRFYASGSVDYTGDGTNDIYAAPTLSTLQNSITSWAKDTKKLLVYFIDHGQRNQFRLNKTEYLQASALDSWLDTLQAGGGGPQATVVIDACEAGSMLDEIAASRRIIITSSNAGPLEGIALFDKTRYISFSLSFWVDIFNGATYGKAFDTAKGAIEAVNPLQTPLIADDGDATPNESADGIVADDVRPGNDFDVRSPGVFIGDVAPNQVISSSSATLWLADVVSNFPVEEAGALIVPPNFQRPSSDSEDEQPVTGLSWIDFTYSEANSRWQGTYSAFNEGGLFQAQYFVKAGGLWYASPRIGFIDRIGRPDAWENDNSASAAKWISVNSVQGHNFHVSGDQDWVRFTSLAGQSATIAVVQPRQKCRPTVELYRASDLKDNAKATPVRTITAATPGEEVVFEQAFTTSEQYILCVKNADTSAFGEGTSYLLLVAVDTGGGGIIPTSLFITTLDNDTSEPLSDVNITFAGSTIGATQDGVLAAIVPEYGTYSITATCEGYKTKSQTVSVRTTTAAATLRMVPGEGSEGEGEKPQCACGGIAPDSHDGTHGNMLLAGVLTAAVLLAAQRRRRPVTTP